MAENSYRTLSRVMANGFAEFVRSFRSLLACSIISRLLIGSSFWRGFLPSFIHPVFELLECAGEDFQDFLRGDFTDEFVFAAILAAVVDDVRVNEVLDENHPVNPVMFGEHDLDLGGEPFFALFLEVSTHALGCTDDGFYGDLVDLGDAICDDVWHFDFSFTIHLI